MSCYTNNFIKLTIISHYFFLYYYLKIYNNIIIYILKKEKKGPFSSRIVLISDLGGFAKF